MSRIPLIVVVGSTGVGKTNLSIALAQSQGGEIVCADSIQIYENFDVGSAKPSVEEQAQAPHHQYSHIPCIEACDVLKYVKLADAAILDIHKRGKLPILCGGTHFYIENVLFETQLALASENMNISFPEAMLDSETMFLVAQWEERYPDLGLFSTWLKTMETEHLYDMQYSIDSERAQHQGKNNRRLRASLERVYTTKEQESTVLQLTQGRKGVQLRYKPIILWLTSSTEQLLDRCTARVQSMYDQNQIIECLDLFQLYTQRCKHSMNAIETKESYGKLWKGEKQVDTTVGVLQGIGIKEQKPWMDSFINKDVLQCTCPPMQRTVCTCIHTEQTNQVKQMLLEYKEEIYRVLFQKGDTSILETEIIAKYGFAPLQKDLVASFHLILYNTVRYAKEQSRNIAARMVHITDQYTTLGEDISLFRMDTSLTVGEYASEKLFSMQETCHILQTLHKEKIKTTDNACIYPMITNETTKTTLELWNTQIVKPAIELIQHVLQRSILENHHFCLSSHPTPIYTPAPFLSSTIKLDLQIFPNFPSNPSLWPYFILKKELFPRKKRAPEEITEIACELCGITVRGPRDWESHIKGKSHKQK